VRMSAAVNVASRSEVATVSIGHAMQPGLLGMPITPDNGV